MLATDARLIDANGDPLGLTAFSALRLGAGECAALHQGRGFEILLRRSLVTGATAALRRSALLTALPVGRGWIHDEWLAVVLASIGRVDIVEQPLIDYRQHANNQVGMRRRGMSKADIHRYRDAFRALFFGEGEFRARLERVAADIGGDPQVDKMIDFIRAGKRPLTMAGKRGEADEDA